LLDPAATVTRTVIAQWFSQNDITGPASSLCRQSCFNDVSFFHPWTGLKNAERFSMTAIHKSTGPPSVFCRMFLRSIGLFGLLLLACGSEPPGAKDEDIPKFAEIYGDYLLAISSDSAKTPPNPAHLEKILAQHGMSREQFVQGMEAIEKDGQALQKFLEIVNSRVDKAIKSQQAGSAARSQELLRHPVDGTILQPRQVP
jgi:hypothetical protein